MQLQHMCILPEKLQGTGLKSVGGVDNTNLVPNCPGQAVNPKSPHYKQVSVVT